MGIITGASYLGSDEMVDIAHVDSQVIVIIFWASWCNYSKNAIQSA